MTLQSFAMASRAALGMPDKDLNAAVDLAGRIGDAIRVNGDAGMRGMLWGAGLWLAPNGAALKPTVLVPRAPFGDPLDDFEPIQNVPLLEELVMSLLGGAPSSDLDTLQVLFADHGVQHVAPGDQVSAALTGRAGPHVRWASGRVGFLTAGHVATTVSASVTDAAGTSVGNVIWTNDPGRTLVASGDVDVALVSLNPGQMVQVGKTATVAGAGDRVDILSNQSAATVFGFWDILPLGAPNAYYSQCYATDTKVTQPGDSGGLVEKNGEVVGMVVGGFVRRDMTIIQSIQYQMTELRQRSGHMLSL